jgi:hypothetical protein
MNSSVQQSMFIAYRSFIDRSRARWQAAVASGLWMRRSDARCGAADLARFEASNRRNSILSNKIQYNHTITIDRFDDD